MYCGNQVEAQAISYQDGDESTRLVWQCTTPTHAKWQWQHSVGDASDAPPQQAGLLWDDWARLALQAHRA